MATCSVRWRSSGGRGEFEYVPADTLLDRNILLFIEEFNLIIPAEVFGVKANGKSRLRKIEPNNRNKLHLPQLVMAIARLPEPAREKKNSNNNISFPLRSKSFVMDEMIFDIIEDDGIDIKISPLNVSIKNYDYIINIQDQIKSIKKDIDNIDKIKENNIELAESIIKHRDIIFNCVNSREIRNSADNFIRLQERIFGFVNASSITSLEEAGKYPETLEEKMYGVEGRLLMRIHIYRERDGDLPKITKNYYKDKNGGRLICESCKLDPTTFYGEVGEKCLEAHHRIPVSELQPDSIMRVEDMAVVCASCHRIIHTRKPCFSIDEMQEILKNNRN